MGGDGRTIGLAPLQVRDQTASIVGSVNVCDYQDFVVIPGEEKDFFNAVLDDLRQKGVQKLVETMRQTTIVRHLMPLAQERQYSIDYHQSDASSDMDLSLQPGRSI